MFLGFKILTSPLEEQKGALESYSFTIGDYLISLQGVLKQELCVDFENETKNDCIMYEGKITIKKGEEEFLFRIRTYRKVVGENNSTLEGFVKELVEGKERTLEEELDSIISKVEGKPKNDENSFYSLDTCVGVLYPERESNLVIELKK